MFGAFVVRLSSEFRLHIFPDPQSQSRGRQRWVRGRYARFSGDILAEGPRSKEAGGAQGSPFKRLQAFPFAYGTFPVRTSREFQLTVRAWRKSQ